jgi:hypothetical protein
MDADGSTLCYSKQKPALHAVRAVSEVLLSPFANITA